MNTETQAYRNLDDEVAGEIVIPDNLDLDTKKDQPAYGGFFDKTATYAILFVMGAALPYYYFGYSLSSNSANSKQKIDTISASKRDAFYLGCLPALAQGILILAETFRGSPLIFFPILTNAAFFAVSRKRNRLENLVETKQ